MGDLQEEYDREQCKMSHNTSNTTTTRTANTETRSILHLRNKKSSRKTKPTNKVRWTEDVVDNENMDKKKSKICCIFHPQREFGELSSESSDSSSDESDKSDDDMGERNDSNSLDANGASGHDACCPKHKHKQKKPNKSSPNAYEKQPTYKNK